MPAPYSAGALFLIGGYHHHSLTHQHSRSFWRMAEEKWSLSQIISYCR